ncbi:MAG: hypothetical protein ABIJ00_08170 [Candidatus Eisenbacteria bacterium]
MSHSVRYDEELRLTEIVYRGKVNTSALKKGAAEAAQVARDHDCFLILIDCRESALSLSTMDIYDLPKKFSHVLSKLGLEVRRFKRALVVPNDMVEYSFLETVSQNRGQNAMIFRDIDEAKAWLSGK